MTSDKIKCVISLGSKKINCIIAEINDDLSIKILAYSSVRSKGIHNGVIIDSVQATRIIRSCVSDVEKKAKIVLKKINVVFEIPEFVCTRLSKYQKIDGSKIHKNDIEFLLKEAKKEVTLNDLKKSIIHIFNHNYIVDGKNFIKEPIDVYADFLSHEMTFVTVPKNIIKNISQVFVNCDLEIERFISNIFALAVNYFNDTQFQLGATLIDIGFEKTSFALFQNYALIHSVTFPIGINHVTKDISRVCSLSFEESVNIKNEIGCGFAESSTLNQEGNNLSEEFFKDSKFRRITKGLISEIINARVKDIFDIVKKEIKFSGLNLTCGQNIFLTGGGSKISNLKNFSSDYFNVDTKLIEFSKKDSNSLGNKDEIYDSCNGALKIIHSGWETEAIPEVVNKERKLSFLSKILRDIT